MAQTHKMADRASSVTLGITVILLYAVFVSSVFAGFATYIYRSEWEANFATGVGDLAGRPAVDLDNLIFNVTRESELQQALLALRRDKVELTAEKASLEAARDVAFGQIRQASDALILREAFHHENLQGIGIMLMPQDRDKLATIFDQGDTIPVTLRTALLHLESARGSPDLGEDDAARLKAAIIKANADISKFEGLHREHSDIAHQHKASLTTVEGKIQRIEVDETDYSTRLADITARIGAASQDRARLEALAMDVPVIGDVFQRLVSFPTIFLTLIVTIAAGGLGTVVAFSRRYYSKDGAGLTAARLFVNVGEGIAAAIAIFLFSGAGMLALTQGGGASNDVELSPFTVAFVAFLSGFMAEDAFASIQTAGRRIFRSDEDDNEASG